MSAGLDEAWRKQVAYCDAHGSPFTARVLEAAWADWQQGGTLRALLPGWAGNAWADAVPLRVAAALHSLALEGSSPQLAALYPPAAETFDARAGPGVVFEAMRLYAERIRDYLGSAPQTNEVGRSAVLLGGFAAITQFSRLPLATLEIGASAGLNQLWHRYRYTLDGTTAWGDPASPVLIRSEWQGRAPTLPARFELASQAACDIAPLDLAAPGAALRLASYIWPDQRERLERLQAAITLALQAGVVVEAADALEWLERQLAEPRPGVTRVLVHSVMWQYMPAPTRAALRACIAAAGARATPAAPLAWLAFEPDRNGVFELSLHLWPGPGVRRVLATAQAHGRSVVWA
jgi:hypothetical protein